MEIVDIFSQVIELNTKTICKIQMHDFPFLESICISFMEVDARNH